MRILNNDICRILIIALILIPIYSIVSNLDQVPVWYPFFGKMDQVDFIWNSTVREADEKYENYCIGSCIDHCTQVSYEVCRDFCELCVEYDGKYYCCESKEYGTCYKICMMGKNCPEDCLKSLEPYYAGLSGCNNIYCEYIMESLNQEILDQWKYGTLELHGTGNYKLIWGSDFPVEADQPKSFYYKIGDQYFYPGYKNRFGEVSWGFAGYVEIEYYSERTESKVSGYKCDLSSCSCVSGGDGSIYDTESECEDNCKCLEGCKGYCEKQEMNGRTYYCCAPPSSCTVCNITGGCFGSLSQCQMNCMCTTGVCYGSCNPVYQTVTHTITSRTSIQIPVKTCSSDSDCPSNSVCIDQGEIYVEDGAKITVYKEYDDNDQTKIYWMDIAIGNSFCNYWNNKVLGIEKEVPEGTVIITKQNVKLIESNGYLKVAHNYPIFGKYLYYGCEPSTYKKASPEGNYGCCYQKECWDGSQCVQSGTVRTFNGEEYICDGGSWYALGSCYDVYGITCYKKYYIEEPDLCLMDEEFQSEASSHYLKTCYKQIMESCIKGVVVSDNLINRWDCCPDCSYNDVCYPEGSEVDLSGRNYLCHNHIWYDPDNNETVCTILLGKHWLPSDETFLYGQKYCCGDDENEHYSCSPVNPEDCGCVEYPNCYHGGREYRNNTGFYHIDLESISNPLSNKTITYYLCVDGEWEEISPSIFLEKCNPLEASIKTEIDRTGGILPSYIVNASSEDIFNLMVSTIFEYEGGEEYNINGVFGGDAKVYGRFPVPLNATGTFTVYWSPMMLINSMCCGDEKGEVLNSRICTDMGNPYLTCFSDLNDVGCNVIDPDTFENVTNESCGWIPDADLRGKCFSEGNMYVKNNAEELLQCVYDGKLYKSGDILIIERNVDYGIKDREIGLKNFYYQFSDLPGLGAYDSITGIPIYRGNVTFEYNLTSKRLRVSYSEKRKIPLKCVNGIWVGTCGDGVCEEWENSKDCPEDCCLRNCVDKSTGMKSKYCVGFNGCSEYYLCLGGYQSVCLNEINISYPVNRSMADCVGNVCTWVNETGFNIIQNTYVRDCKNDVNIKCGEKAVGATILEYYMYSPYAYLMDLEKLSNVITANTTCKQYNGYADCVFIEGEIDMDKYKKMCEESEGVWLEDHPYCNLTMRLSSCCCGDDIGEVPVNEKYIDFFGKLSTNRYYCISNPTYCVITVNQSAIMYCRPGTKIGIKIISSCDIDAVFKNALNSIVYLYLNKSVADSYFSEYLEAKENCRSVNYTFEILDGICWLGREIIRGGSYDLYNEIGYKAGNKTETASLFNATLFPGNYTCQNGYWVLDNLTVVSVNYPIKLSFGVRNVYNIEGETSGRYLEDISGSLRYVPAEVEGWR